MSRVTGATPLKRIVTADWAAGVGFTDGSIEECGS